MKTPDRVAFNIFGFDIMWYGILVALAISSVVAIVCLRAKRHSLSSDAALNISLICAVAGLVGARLYFVIFNWSWYGEDLIRVFKIREGGLAIHGGLIAGLVAAVIISRMQKIRLLNMCDLFFAVIPLGQAIGRWGNFFNGEAHGPETTLPWAVIIDGKNYHPTFLYESLWCLALFAVLIILDNKRKFDGQIFLLYCIGYSFERFFVEGLRTDSLMLFGVLKQAQVLSALVFICAIIAYVYLMRRMRKQLPIISGAFEPVVIKLGEVEAEIEDAADAADAVDDMDDSGTIDVADEADAKEAVKDAAVEDVAESEEAEEVEEAGDVAQTVDDTDDSDATEAGDIIESAETKDDEKVEREV